MKVTLLFSFLFVNVLLHAQTLEVNPSTVQVTGPTALLTLNDQLLYVGTKTGSGKELWTTDGTAAGNHMVKEIGTYSGSPVTNAFSYTSGIDSYGYFGKLGNNIFFQASKDDLFGNPTTFWTSDGTLEGTVQLGPNMALRYCRFYKEFNGRLYFTAYNNANGREIWSTDGTWGGTTLLKDINPGTNGSTLETYDPHFTIFNGKLFFVANDGTHGYELWSTDGTQAGTTMFIDILTAENPTSTTFGGFYRSSQYSGVPFAIFNNKMYFAANDGSSIGQDFLLYTTDGTVSGTSKYIVPTPVDCQCGNDVNVLGSIKGMTVADSQIYVFAAPKYGALTQSGLWTLDGNGNSALLKFFSGNAGDSGLSDGTVPGVMRLFNGDYYFLGSEVGVGISPKLELWKMNSATHAFSKIVGLTDGGTSVFNNNEGLLSIPFDGKLYFSKSAAFALCSTDGTAAGTNTVAKNAISAANPGTVATVQSITGMPKEFKVYNNNLYFPAAFSGQAAQLWRITGQNLGTETQQLTTITAYPNPTRGMMVFNFGEQLNDANMKVYNTVGSVVYEKNNISGSQFDADFTTFESGLYIVKIEELNASRVIRFIKQ